MAAAAEEPHLTGGPEQQIAAVSGDLDGRPAGHNPAAGEHHAVVEDPVSRADRPIGTGSGGLVPAVAGRRPGAEKNLIAGEDR